MEVNKNCLTLKSEIKILLESEIKLGEYLLLNMTKRNNARDFFLRLLNDLNQQEMVYSKINSILNTKIQVGVIGMSNSGKSTFLNSLIGKPILDHDTQKCTYFGTRIQASLNTKETRFYELGNQEIVFSDFKEIHEKMKLINFEQRNNNLQSKDVWVLETDIRAFSGNTRFDFVRDIYEHIELIDFPGIDDVKEKLDEISLDVKFSSILEKVDLDAFIILLDYTKQEEVKKLFTYFHKHLFHGKHQLKLQEIICKGRFLIVANKYEPADPTSAEKDKKSFKEHIFKDFFIPEETNFLKKIFLNDPEAKKILRFDPSKIEEKVKTIESQVIFVSSKKAKFPEIEELRNELNDSGFLSPADIENLIEIEKEKIKNAIYDESSNFENLVEVLSKLLIKIGEKKLIEPLKRAKEYLLNVNKVVMQHKDSKCNLNTNFKAIQNEIMTLFQVLEKETKEFLDNFENFGTILTSLPPENISESCQIVFQMAEVQKKIEIKINEVQNEAQMKFSDSNIYLICSSILRQELELLKNQVFYLLIEIIFNCFRPNYESSVILEGLIPNFFMAKTNEEKDAFSNYFKLILPKTSEISYDEKIKSFQEIFGIRSKNICRYIQVTRIKIGSVLEYYKSFNEICD